MLVTVTLPCPELIKILGLVAHQTKSDVVTLRIEVDKITALAQNAGVYFRHAVPATQVAVDDDLANPLDLTLAVKPLSQAIRGRETVDMRVNLEHGIDEIKEVEFISTTKATKGKVARKYTGVLTTLEKQALTQFPTIKNSDYMVITDDHLRLLSELNQHLSLKPIYTKDAPLLAIRAANKTLKAAATDRHHLVIYTIPDFQSEIDFDLVITLPILPVLISLFKAAPKRRMAVQNGTLFIDTRDMRLVMPLLQATESLSLDTMLSYYQSVSNTEPTGSVTVNNADLQQTLSNMFSVLDAAAAVAIQSDKKNNLVLSISTSFGRVTEVLHYKANWGDKAFGFDPTLLFDTLSVFPDSADITLNFVESKCVWVALEVENIASCSRAELAAICIIRS